MPAPTIKDIALRLGLSASTVSRALAGHERIPEVTRKAVTDAAAKLGYVPNRAAQSLVGGRNTGFAGLILTDPGYGREDSFLGEYLSALGRGLSEAGIDLFLTAIPEGQSELSVLRNIVRSRRADGLILARTTETDERVEALIEAGFPFVTHGRVAREDTGHDWIDTDGAAAFSQAFDMLYALGHRRFALLTIEEPMMFRLHRTEGLLAAISERGDPDVRLTVCTSPRFDSERRHAVIEAMLAEPERPTAIIALFDALALAVLQVAEHLSIGVPSDLSVVGFDNIGSATLSRPGLTTFDGNTAGSARLTASLLAARINDPSAAPSTHIITPRLVLRASHGPAPE